MKTTHRLISYLLVSLVGLAFPALANEFPQVSLPSAEGGQVSVASLRGSQATVFVFLSCECPISNGYVPTLNELATKFSPQGVAFVGLNPNVGQSLKEIDTHRREYRISFPVLKDAGAGVAERFGVKTCPEVCVLDAAGRVRYAGRIDDRYARRGGAASEVRQASLAIALEQLLAGKEIAEPRTTAIGCAISAQQPTPAWASASDVTYSDQIARILNRHCVTCHRPGGIGPFALTTFNDARNWADDVRRFTADGTMPPWRPVAGWGEFTNRRGMTSDEISAIDRWVSAGCPEGDRAKLPEPLVFRDDWRLGKPDLILEPSEEYTLAADGRDEFRCFVFPTNYDRDQFVVAVEVLPGNARVVHHVINFVDTSGRAAELDARDPAPGYATNAGAPGFFPRGGLGGWAPGNTNDPLPEGMAKVLPKGAHIVMQVHYHKTGKPETDRTRLGIHFARKPITRAVRAMPVMPPGGPLSGMLIPAGATNHEVNCSAVISEDLLALQVTPHMHLLGKDMQVTATLPDGRVERLVWVKNWDFNWQESYRFVRPTPLPKGTRIDVVAHFDNSTSNRSNPRAVPQPVGWGEQTTDEMCIAFIEVAPQALARGPQDLRLHTPAEQLRMVLASQADARKAGKLPPAVELLMQSLEKRLKDLETKEGK
jgi:peroxiredoxin